VGSTTLLQRRSKLGRLLGIHGTIQPAMETTLNNAIWDALRDVYTFERWDFLDAYSRVELEAAYAAGTISVTAAATAWTGTGTTWDTGWTANVKVLADGNIYRVASIDSTTAITSTDAALATLTNTEYTLFINEYSLDSALENVEAVSVHSGGGRLTPVMPSFLEAAKAQGLRIGTPEYFANAGIDANGYTRIEVWPIPGANQILEVRGYRAGTIPTGDSSTDDVPQRFSNVVDHRAEFYVWKHKNDPRMQIANGEFGREISMMVDKHSVNQGPVRIQLDPNVHRPLLRERY
jgi:hypothetical protein